MNFTASKMNKVVVIVLLFCVCCFSTSYIPKYNILKAIAMGIIAIYIIGNFRKIKTQGNGTINTVAVIICFISMFSSLINRSLITNNDIFVDSVMLSVTIMEMLLVMEIMAAEKELENALDIFYKLTLIIVAITDILIIFFPNARYYFQGWPYFTGTKFSVAYRHMYLITLMIASNRIKGVHVSRYRLKFLLICILTVWISVKVDCNTGVIGAAIVILICVFFKRFLRLMYKPAVFLVVLLLCCSFMYVYEMILSNAHVQYFITNVLGRSLTLTGRIGIYETLPIVLKNRWVYGYGYGSTYMMCMRFWHVADTQNGLAEWIMQIGAPGTVMLVLIMLISFNKLNNIKNAEAKKDIFPIVAIIYAFTILASVEITISVSYIFWIVFLYAYAKQEENR